MTKLHTKKSTYDQTCWAAEWTHGLGRQWVAQDGFRASLAWRLHRFGSRAERAVWVDAGPLRDGVQTPGYREDVQADHSEIVRLRRQLRGTPEQRVEAEDSYDDHRGG